jgi:hypothetical protein
MAMEVIECVVAHHFNWVELAMELWQKNANVNNQFLKH